MVRQAFLAILVLATLVGAVSAQVRVQARGSKSPYAIQQPPVYLKSLTNAREKELEEHEDVENGVPVDATIHRIARAFETGNDEDLEAFLVTGKRKIYLALEIENSEMGHFGPGQIRHIFGRLFDEVETRSFVYDSRELERRSDSTVFRADWTYVVLDTDELVTAEVQIGLEQGKSDWRIYEIRATAR